jgi:hypothetical protein
VAMPFWTCSSLLMIYSETAALKTPVEREALQQDVGAAAVLRPIYRWIA